MVNLSSLCKFSFLQSTTKEIAAIKYCQMVGWQNVHELIHSLCIRFIGLKFSVITETGASFLKKIDQLLCQPTFPFLCSMLGYFCRAWVHIAIEDEMHGDQTLWYKILQNQE